VGAATLIACAAALHLYFCEWRTIRSPLSEAPEAEARVLVRFARTLHPEGNAAEWDAYQLALRDYHADWVECWQEHPEAEACADVALRTKDATVWAVQLRDCGRERGLGVSRSWGLRACLAGRGRLRAPEPAWTTQHIGHRSEDPAVELRALFAEARTGAPRSDRALAWRLGILGPALACTAAAWLLTRRRLRGAD